MSNCYVESLLPAGASAKSGPDECIGLLPLPPPETPPLETPPPEADMDKEQPPAATAAAQRADHAARRKALLERQRLEREQLDAELTSLLALENGHAEQMVGEGSTGSGAGAAQGAAQSDAQGDAERRRVEQCRDRTSGAGQDCGECVCVCACVCVRDRLGLDVLSL